MESVRSRLYSDTLKMRFLASKIGHYERALALSTTLPAHSAGQRRERVSQSFQLAERARARSLLDLLAESRAHLHQGVDPELLEREKGTRDRLNVATVALASAQDPLSRAAARADLDSARRELERLQIETRLYAPRYGEITFPAPASLEEIREILAGGEVLLEYFIGEENAWLWVVGRDDAAFHVLPHPQEIQARIAGAVTAAAAELGQSDAELVAAETVVSRAILPPELPPAARRLIVVPDGPLHHVPFEALRAGGQFLVERHEGVVLPSATALRLMRKQPLAVVGSGFLGVGDPIPAANNGRFPRLPFSREEVEGIASLFPQESRRVLTGKAATKAQFNSLDLGRFRYVHFATHGWLDAEDLRQSGLRLSAGEGDDGADLLSVDEIFGLKLSAELVPVRRIPRRGCQPLEYRRPLDHRLHAGVLRRTEDRGVAVVRAAAR